MHGFTRAILFGKINARHMLISDDMTQIILNSLAVTFAVSFARALPLPQWMFLRKPLSCNVCMVGWVLIIGATFNQSVTPTIALYTGGLALLLIALLQKLTETGKWVPPS